jgi:hypothetical protein
MWQHTNSKDASELVPELFPKGNVEVFLYGCYNIVLDLFEKSRISDSDISV